MTADVTFWFDPICPFTWRTSRWLRSVTAPRGLLIDWRLMSLATLNDGKELPESYQEAQRRGWQAARALVAAGRHGGAEAVGRLYDEIGTRTHEQGRELSTELISEAVVAAGLPDAVADAAGDRSLDDEVRASHEQGQRRVGTESGSPILAVGDGPGFFGPVVSPVPTGEDAERLFDAVRLLAAVPQFSELKRARAA